MGYVKINILETASLDDLQRWEEHMLEKAKCWNKFCLGLCDEHDLCAVYVVREGAGDEIYLTTLCKDCLKDTANYGILVNENHLMLDIHRKQQQPLQRKPPVLAF